MMEGQTAIFHLIAFIVFKLIRVSGWWADSFSIQNKQLDKLGIVDFQSCI